MAIREFEMRLALSSGVLGTKRAREEAIHVAEGGPRGERAIAIARAVRAIREVPDTRASGSEGPVVAFAMVWELRDNKRGICGRSREGVTAAILMAAAMAAAQEGMKARQKIQIRIVWRELIIQVTLYSTIVNR